MENLKIKDIGFHRNGSGGAGFYVVKFIYKDEGQVDNFVGIVFPKHDENGEVSEEYSENVAVIESHPDNMVSRTMRGADYFGPTLTRAIIAWNKNWRGRWQNELYADGCFGLGFAQNNARKRDKLKAQNEHLTK